MDDELRSLQEKLRSVSARLSNFALNKQSAEELRAEYKQLLLALEKFTPSR
jgi:acyl carrier protein phosphodiesterase